MEIQTTTPQKTPHKSNLPRPEQNLPAIVIPQTTINPKLTPQQVAIVKASTGTPAFVSTQTGLQVNKTVTQTVVNAIAGVYYYKGYGVPGLSDQERSATLSQMAAITLYEISQIFPHCTESDISLLFERGRRGEYGEYKIISIETFVIWCKAYVAQRAVAAVEQRAFVASQSLPAPKPPTPEEWNATMTRRLRQNYDLANAGRNLELGWLVWGWLHDIGLASVTYEQANRYRAEARDELALANDPSLALTFDERRERRSFLKLLESDNNVSVKNLSREIALRELLLSFDDAAFAEFLKKISQKT